MVFLFFCLCAEIVVVEDFVFGEIYAPKFHAVDEPLEIALVLLILAENNAGEFRQLLGLLESGWRKCKYWLRSGC